MVLFDHPPQDLSRMEKHIKNVVQEYFPEETLPDTNASKTLVNEEAEGKEEEEEEEGDEGEMSFYEYVFRDPLLFGDYRFALNDDEIRRYEDLIDYEAVFHILQQVRRYFSRKYTVTLRDGTSNHLSFQSRAERDTGAQPESCSTSLNGRQA